MMLSNSSKRPRDSMSHESGEVSMVLSEIHQAITSVQRRRVLEKIHHRSHVLSNALLEAGILRALCLQLGFVMNRPVMDSDADMVCHVICSLLQCCTDGVREEAIADVGRELLTLLIKLWRKHGSSKQVIVMSIWSSFASCSTGSIMLVQDYDLLQILAQVLEIDPASKALVDEVVGIFKYLTHYAPDHRLSTLERYGRHLSQLPLIITSDRTYERLSAIYRNLALTPSVRLVMAEHSHVLTALIQMCSQSRGNHKTIRNVLSTLESLGMDADSCMLLLLHSDGVILNLLLHFLSFSNDEVVRRRSARALRLLARDKAVPILLQYTNVLQALFSAATGDDSLDVRREAASAYTSCASKVPSEMTTIHKQVLESLTELAQGPAYESVALAFKHQAEISQNRTSLVANEDFLIQVSAIALRHDVGTLAKEYIVSALERLSGDVTVRHALVMPHILTVLVQNASVPGAVQALLQLASISPDTRKRLVTHRGLLQALISFTATCADHGDKENVKNTMLLLIPAL